jgi:hypothetical protein
MNIEPLHEEEAFGILSSDNIYLDCILVKPKVLEDSDIEALYIWVPKYPLTKTTLIICARHEINAEWREGKAAHLVFDLRGTGDSDGTLGDRNFQSDLKGIEIWAGERFGNVDLVILGRPEGQGKAHIFPVRPGVIIEYYHYPAAAGSAEKNDKPSTSPIPLLYLATPGNFSVIDDAVCQRLAQAGYDVYGLDPLRYLLHASSRKRLTPADI